jgi:hypothetical protein
MSMRIDIRQEPQGRQSPGFGCALGAGGRWGPVDLGQTSKRGNDQWAFAFSQRSLLAS